MISIVLRWMAFLAMLLFMVTATVIAVPPEPNLPEQDNIAATASESPDSQEKKAGPGAIVNVPSAGLKEEKVELKVDNPNQTVVEKPSGRDKKTISNMNRRRSTRKALHDRREKRKKGQVFCDKTTEDSGSVLIDCADSSREKQRKSYTTGYMILTPPESLVILPFKNASGQKELDWLSIGLWDIFAEKFGYVQGFRVIPIRDYIKEAGRPPGELSNLDREKAMELARDLSARQVWTGEFRKDERGYIEIELEGFSVKNGSEVFSKKQKGPLGGLPLKIDIMIEEILVDLKSRQKKNVLRKMNSRYVGDMKAWEHNALGFERLLLALLTGKGKKRDGLIEESIGFHRASVNEGPVYASGWSGLGWALLEKGDIEGAKEAFSQSIRIKPFFIDGNMGMGYALWEENNIGEAVPFMKEAMNQNPAIEWKREDMKRTALRLNFTRDTRKRKHYMGGIQIIGP